MTIGKISEFDINKDDWKLYIERLEQYFVANAVKAELQVATLITVMGSQGYELLVNLCTPVQPKHKTFQQLVTVMENHLQPKPSELAERYKFKQRTQKSGESIAEYVAVLKKMSMTCSFGSWLEESLRDQLACGLSSETIRQRLFAETGLNFAKAYTLAVNLESAEKDAASVVEGQGRSSDDAKTAECQSISSSKWRRNTTMPRGTSRAEAGESVDSGGGVSGIGRWRVRAPAAPAPSRHVERARRQQQCRACGGAHDTANCKFGRYVCRVCNKMGHLRRMCPNITSQHCVEAAAGSGSVDSDGICDSEDSDELSAILLVLLHLSMHVVDEGHAVNPSCTCIRFTSTYGKERGTFSSPDYPRPYPPALDCLLYTFLAAPHQIVELMFTDFDIYKDHLDCIRGDYLKVYWEVQGPGPPGAINERSAWARELCGSRADSPAALYSPGPALVLEFHTGPKQGNATGFVGTYSFVDKRLFETDGVRLPGTECDYQFSRSGNRPTHGRLYSPQYPSIYPNNVRCSYHFHARPKERVKVVFEEISLQKGDISCLRRADIIKVFDGRDTNAPAIAMLCNELTGYEVLSTGPALLLQFTANSATPGQGFAATFHFQPPPDSTAADSDRLLKLSFGKAFESLGPEVSATTSSCHQEFSSDGTKHGTLTSPHYPSPYPPNTHCHYEFFGRGKERVRLIFLDFFLYKSEDGSLDCTNVDSLQAFVNVDGRLEKVDAFCGVDLPKPIMSNGPKLMLEFRGTHSSRYARGFKISYSFVENFGITSGRQLKEFPCAFVYNSTESRNGTFASPNSPGPYPRDTECTYFFHGAETEKVHLHFTSFDVEGVLPCEAVSASDYVEFSNHMTEDNRYGRYCGQMKEFHVESERNFFKVTFRSNDRLDGTGFKAIYQFLDVTDEYRSPMTEEASNSVCIFANFLMLIAALATQLHHQLYH